ncbi:MAG: uroporphyrinogen-III synthase [Alphaproteobacteria bacterium]|nr:uroporphyrinogen-III synthase [Alphaproteobacteria bacterium]
MRVLITRHASAAAKLAAILESEGFEIQLEPLLEIKFDVKPVSLKGVQALIVTSANAAAGLAQSVGERDLTTFAVGDATARALEIEGFRKVLSSAGDVTSLISLITETLKPDAGHLVHVSGEHIAGDLAGDLTAKGFAVRREVLYRAETPSVLSDAAIQSFRGRNIDVVLFFSHRTAMTFASLVVQTGLADDFASVSAICLSEACARPIRDLGWQKIKIAETPDQQALRQTLLSLRN